MAKVIEVDVKLIFGNPDKHADVQSHGVPISLILEAINNLAGGLAKQLVREAKQDVSEEEEADYLQGMLNLDRLKLKEMLK